MTTDAMADIPAQTDPGDEEDFQRVKRRGLRTGYTTGACATAAAAAATRALLTGQPLREVTIRLPAGQDVTFSLARCELSEGACRCGVIKDAGDDPDVTHGAEIQATVRWNHKPDIELRGGVGVGTVTRPGLGLEVGGPAINPVPRQMITQHVAAALSAANNPRGVVVEVAVPNGETLARKTLNGRLGIVGGISILGTTGIVQPWSTAAWRASVEQAVDVAAANGQQHIVLTTGGRTEKYGMALLGLPDIAYVEMGIFTGHALRRCAARGIERVALGGMIGKFSKLAQGHFQTHVAGNQVDPAFLADMAAACNAPAALQQDIRNANTARHVQELVSAAGVSEFFQELTQAVADRSYAYAKGKLDIEAILFDFDGSVLGRAKAAHG